MIFNLFDITYYKISEIETNLPIYLKKLKKKKKTPLLNKINLIEWYEYKIHLTKISILITILAPNF